jgi:hypothetical protein
MNQQRADLTEPPVVSAVDEEDEDEENVID